MGIADVDIRPARWKDIRGMAQLYVDDDEVGRRYFHPLPRTPARLRAHLIGLVGAGYATRWLGPRSGIGRFCFLVALDAASQVPVGFASLRLRRASDRAWVARTGVMVALPWRRRGIGRALKLTVLGLAQDLGAARAEAFLHPENAGSVALNRSLGLRLRDVVPADHAPSGVGPLIAERELEGSFIDDRRSVGGKPPGNLHSG